MDRERLQNIDLIARILSSIVTIAGLSVIVWQAFVATRALEVQAKAVEVQAWQGISNEMTEINKQFIEHPELYPYFEKNKQIKPNDRLYPKVISLADMILDFTDQFDDDFVRKLAGMEDGGKYWNPWNNYFKDNFRRSPALCNRYIEVKSWYPDKGILSKIANECCNQTGKGM